MADPTVRCDKSQEKKLYIYIYIERSILMMDMTIKTNTCIGNAHILHVHCFNKFAYECMFVVQTDWT